MHHGWRVALAAIATLAATLAIAQSAAGAVVVSPSTLTFPDTLVGEESSQTVTFTNTGPGGALLSLFGVTFDSDFRLGGGNCPILPSVFPSGASCEYALRFVPSSRGPKTATFVWATSGAAEMGTVELEGLGLQPPTVGFGPAPAFPDQRIDAAGPARTVTVTNTGDLPLDVSDVSLTGPDAAAFELLSEDCTATTIAPAATCDVTLRFAPAAAGARTAALRLAGNSPAGPSDLALSATGLTPPQVELGPAPSFPLQVPGTTGPGRTVTVTNTGQAPLTVNAVSLTGPDAGDFTLAAQTCTAGPIAAGGSCEATIRFAPTGLGARAAALRVASDAPSATDELALAATAVPHVVPAPVLVALAPGHGAPGTLVTLEGAWLGTATHVRFGDAEAEPIEPLAFDRLTAVVPDGTPGRTVEVRVHGPGGTSEPLPFTYDPAPQAAASTGPRPAARRCVVPDLTDATRRRARRALRRAGCRLGRVLRTADAPRRRAVVLRQSQRPGRVLPARTRVHVRLGRA